LALRRGLEGAQKALKKTVRPIKNLKTLSRLVAGEEAAARFALFIRANHAVAVRAGVRCGRRCQSATCFPETFF